MNKNEDGKSNPYVGICIPAYEDVKLLQRAVDSILWQSYSNFRIYISDDSQTTKIEEYIHALNDRRIEYRHNSKTFGATENTNQAIKMALDDNVDLIKIFYQDDWFTYNNSLLIMVQALITNDADVLFSGNIEKGNEETFHICTDSEIALLNRNITCLFKANYLGAPSNILYKKCDTLLDSRYEWLLDVDFYIRLIGDKKLSYVYEPLITIGHDGNQLSDFYYRNPYKMFIEKLNYYLGNKQIRNVSNFFYLLDYFILCTKICIRNRREAHFG